MNSDPLETAFAVLLIAFIVLVGLYSIWPRRTKRVVVQKLIEPGDFKD